MSYPVDGGPPAGAYGGPGAPTGGFAQQPYGGAPAWGTMPPDKNIGWSIAALLLFWPLAIPSFIAALKVSDLWFTGRYDEALKASADAKKWGVAGVIVGASGFVLVLAAYVVFFLVLVVAAGASGGFD